MPDSTRLPHGVMEGKGAYNKYAKLPGGGAALAAPFLEKAVQNIALDGDDGPIVIADFGSSQGKNSLAPMQLAIRNLRLRLGPNRSIFVFHVDQPSNDFNSLFGVLSSDPDSYALDEANVFPCAIGRSFYEQVLPPDSLHLGWSCYAVVWLRRVPCLVPGHFIPIANNGAERLAFERRGAEDWETFLSLRAREMRPGARLVVVLPAFSDDGVTGFEDLMNHANAVLGEMVDEGAITAQERERMVLGALPRQKSQLLAPFAGDGQFQQLRVEDCETLPLADAAWADYQVDGDAQALATKHALFFRSVFMPSLASALTRVREGDSEAVRSFADQLQDGLTRRLRQHPTPAHSFTGMIVLAKSR